MGTPADPLSLDRHPIPPPRRVRSRRLARLWWQNQRGIIVGLAVVLIVLGYLGFRAYYAQHPAAGSHRPTDLLYYSLQLVPMNSGAMDYPVPWQLEAARLLLPVLAAYAIVVAVVAVFASQLQRLRILALRQHVVICGLGGGVPCWPAACARSAI